MSEIVRDPRAFVGARRRARRPRPSAATVYAGVVLAILAVVELGGLLAVLADAAVDLSVPDGASHLVVVALALAVLAAATGGLLTVGPAALARPALRWWLPLPLARETLLRPGFVRGVVAAVGGGAVAGVIVAVVLGAGSALGAGVGVAAAAVIGGGAGALLYGTTVLLQVDDRAGALGGRLPWVTATLLAAAVAVAALGRGADGAGGAVGAGGIDMVGASWALATAPWVVGAVAVAVLVGAGLVCRAAWRALPRARARTLEASTTSTELVRGAVLSMGDLPGPRPRVPARDDGRPSRDDARHDVPGERGVVRGRTRVATRLLAGARSPAGALLAGQVVAWARHPQRVAQLLSAALVPAAVLAVLTVDLAGAAPVVVVLATLRAVTLAGASAAAVERNPALARTFPLGTGRQRRTEAVLPTVLCGLFLLVMVTALHVTGVMSVAPAGSFTGTAGIVALAAPGLGAAATVAARRPAVEWAAPLLSTSAGAVPLGWIRTALHGRVDAVLVLLPLLLVLVTGALSPATAVVQVGLTAAAWWRATGSRPAGV